MNAAKPMIKRPALLGAVVAAATVAMIGACLGLLGLAAARTESAPQPAADASR